MIAFLFWFAVGVISAAFGSLLGLGGGVIIVPAIIFLSPQIMGEAIPAHVAVGTSLAVLIITALSSTLSFVKQKKVDFRSGWIFFAASGPGAIVGAALTNQFKPHIFQLTFGIFILMMALLLILRDHIKPLNIKWTYTEQYVDVQGNTVTYGYTIPYALAVGFAVGIVSGLFGVGGGSLFVPAMVLLFRYPPHIATATSMFVIFFSAMLGSVAHIVQGNVDWSIFLFLAPGAWIGGKIGAMLAGKLSGAALLWLFRITLVLLAVRMIVS